MTISWYGENCFKLQVGEIVILTDPFTGDSGLSAPRIKGDIVLKTISPFPFPEENTNETFVVNGPGEYDSKGIFITGIQLQKESSENFIKTIYIVKAEGISFCFLGYISENPDATVLEKIDIEGVDVLFFPIGKSKESPFLEPKSAMQFIKNLEPSIAIPSLYAIPGLKRKALDLKEFSSEFHSKKDEGFEMVEKLTLKKKDLTEIKNTKFVAFTS